jgi:hypothetical protein
MEAEAARVLADGNAMAEAAVADAASHALDKCLSGRPGMPEDRGSALGDTRERASGVH